MTSALDPRPIDDLSPAEVRARIRVLRAALDTLWQAVEQDQAAPYVCIGSMKRELIQLEAQARRPVTGAGRV